MGLHTMRRPGGNFASTYHWQDGIGPRDARPVVREPAWKSAETNRFGTHEFLDLAERMAWSPMLTVNLGTGSDGLMITAAARPIALQDCSVVFMLDMVDDFRQMAFISASGRVSDMTMNMVMSGEDANAAEPVTFMRQCRASLIGSRPRNCLVSIVGHPRGGWR
jgi:alpha-L-arabinofuranosidase